MCVLFINDVFLWCLFLSVFSVFRLPEQPAAWTGPPSELGVRLDPNPTAHPRAPRLEGGFYRMEEFKL